MSVSHLLRATRNVIVSVRTAVLVSLVMPVPAFAQACLGTPSGGGVAYDYLRYSIGKGNGATAAVRAGHLALGANFGTRSTSPVSSGAGGGGRIGAVIPIWKFEFCPNLGGSYYGNTWNASNNATIKNSEFTVRGGAGLGIEQHVFKGIYLIPSMGLHYEFTAIKFDVTAPGAKVTTTGDTLHHVAVDVALLLRYRFIYGGASARRFTDGQGPRAAVSRFIIGVALGSPPKRTG